MNTTNKVIEIESYWGHTIGTIELDKNGNIVQMRGLEFVDEDGDYMLGTGKTLMRLQCEQVVDYDEEP